MPYDPKAIANYFLAIANAQGQTLSPLKIQKLVYFANGCHLAIKDVPLINEQVEAWAYSPVIPSLYREFRRYGDQPVTEPATVLSYDSEDPFDSNACETVPTLDDRPADAPFSRTLLDRIWEIYGDYSAIQLSNLTHQDGAPWHQVSMRYHGEIPRGTDIPPEVIRDYFVKLARSKGAAR